MPNKLDTTILQMALIGYEAERQKIQAKITELERRLGSRVVRASTQVATTPKKRRSGPRSTAARRRIAAAQRKRWAEYRRSKQKAA